MSEILNIIDKNLGSDSDKSTFQLNKTFIDSSSPVAMYKTYFDVWVHYID